MLHRHHRIPWGEKRIFARVNRRQGFWPVSWNQLQRQMPGFRVHGHKYWQLYQLAQCNCTAADITPNTCIVPVRAFHVLINPQHTCTARFVVFGLSTCLLPHFLPLHCTCNKAAKSDTTGLSMTLARLHVYICILRLFTPTNLHMTGVYMPTSPRVSTLVWM